MNGTEQGSVRRVKLRCMLREEGHVVGVEMLSHEDVNTTLGHLAGRGPTLWFYFKFLCATRPIGCQNYSHLLQGRNREGMGEDQ